MASTVFHTISSVFKYKNKNNVETFGDDIKRHAEQGYIICVNTEESHNGEGTAVKNIVVCIDGFPVHSIK